MDEIKVIKVANGLPGPSNYQLWLKEGNTGSFQDFLETLRGPEGPEGDTTQAEQLAQAAADTAANAVDAAVAANQAAAAAEQLAIQVAQSQTAGRIAYKTYAELAADLSHPEGTLGEVTNDSDPSLLGTYIKEGGSGSGSWTKSALDLSGRVATVETKTTDIHRRTSGVAKGGPGGLHYHSSKNGRLVHHIDDDGRHWLRFQSAVHEAISDDLLARKTYQPLTRLEPATQPGFWLQYQNGRVQSLEDTLAATRSDPIVFPEHVPNCAYNQWIMPALLEIPSAGLLVASPVAKGLREADGAARVPGSLWAIQQKHGGLLTGHKAGPIRHYVSVYTTDDHNAGCVVADLRPTAKTPLMILQCEHGGPPMRMLEFSRLDVGSYRGEREIPGAHDSSTYAQAARRPNRQDELYILYRTGGANSARWWVTRTLDNGRTWERVALFGDNSEGVYPLAKVTRSGDGFHICFHLNPIGATDQRLVYMHLSWEGVLSDPVNGVQIPNIWDTESDWEYQPFDEDKAMVIRVPQSGRRTRLFDYAEVADGRLQVAFCEFETGPNNNYEGKETEYRLLDVDVAGGVVNHDVKIANAGWPIDATATAKAYFGGIAVVGDWDVILATWDVASYAEWLLEHGTGKLLRMSSADNGASWSLDETIESLTNEKVMRPILATRLERQASGHVQTRMGSHYMYLRGHYEDHYDQFNMNLHFGQL